MMEIVGLILSDGYPDKINRTLYSSTVEMINVDQKFPKTREEEKEHPMDMSPFLDIVDKAPSPRVILTHLQPDLLPEDLLKAKVIYLARNPKDIILSWFQFTEKIAPIPFTMEKVIEDFKNGLIHFGPWPSHIRPFWELKDHKNVTFVFYEDMKKDPAKNIKKIATGIGCPLSEEAAERVLKFSHIDAQKETYKKMEETGQGNLVKAAGVFSFLNKGTFGRWKNYFTVAQNDDFNEWYKTNMGDCDITFTFE